MVRHFVYKYKISSNDEGILIMYITKAMFGRLAEKLADG